MLVPRLVDDVITHVRPTRHNVLTPCSSSDAIDHAIATHASFRVRALPLEALERSFQRRDVLGPVTFTAAAFGVVHRTLASSALAPFVPCTFLRPLASSAQRSSASAAV